MSAPLTTYSDGTLLRGTRLLSITPGGGGTAANYIASDIKITDGVREHMSYSDTDTPDAAFSTNDFGKLTATLIGKTGVTRPNRHDYFAYDTINSVARNWIITSVDTDSSDNQATKWSITARELINGAP